MSKRIIICLFLIGSIAIVKASIKSNTEIKSVKPEFKSAVLVSPAEYDTLIPAFANRFPSSTKGGVIHKDSIKALIESMPTETELVHFVFGIDTTYNKYMVAFKGAKNEGDPDSKILCFRNGNSDDAFCPANCNVNRTGANTTTVKIDIATYKSIYDAFRAARPTMTFGGNIDKQALLDIVNSIDSKTTNLFFMFCTDPATQLRSIIFLGGTVDGDKLMYRNGLNSDSFCPSNCSN